MRILFDSKQEKYKTPYGCLRENEKCKITVEVPKSCPAKQVKLVIEAENGFEMKVPAEKTEGTGDYDSFSCEFSLYRRGLYRYYFEFKTEMSEFSLYRQGRCDTNIEEGEKWQISCLPEGYHAPTSLQGRVMYQIFPDRFAVSGSSELSEKLTPFTLHKDKNEPPRCGADENGRWNNDFYGGNFAGIAEKIPYLMSLGVEIIYLNPIFKAYSNHRYDTADYKKPDPMLGTEEDFKKLCRIAGENGIKIILDGVFSHVGSDSIYFDSENRFGGGAVSDPASKYRDWFDFSSYPTEYKCWWDVKTLPCVNELSPSFVDYIITAEDSVVAHWMRLGAAGFRLDVADELPDEFIFLLRKRVKELDPEGIVIGEVWEDASSKVSYGKLREYFTGAELDGVMNYPFRASIIELVTRKITPREFALGVENICENYPQDVINCCMTFLSTHDTPRIASVFAEKLGEDCLVSALKAASALQFFLPGMPCIYYGDESLMRGGSDPFNRGFFTEDPNSELFSFIKYLSSLRRSCTDLRCAPLRVSADDRSVTLRRGALSLELDLNSLGYEIIRETS